jgi:hypothetical protein
MSVANAKILLFQQRKVTNDQPNESSTHSSIRGNY